MKRENIIRLWVETVMLIAMLALMDVATLGYYMHERVGLILGAMVLVHLLLDRRQVSILCKKLLQNNTPYTMRMSYIVDILLAVGFVVLLVTGVGISLTILTGVQLHNRQFFMEIHDHAGYITLLLLFVHLWLHKGWIKGALRSMKRLWQDKGSGSRRIAAFWLISMVVVIAMTILGVVYLGDAEPTDHRGNGPGYGNGYGWQRGRHQQAAAENQAIGDAVFTLETLV